MEFKAMRRVSMTGLHVDSPAALEIVTSSSFGIARLICMMTPRHTSGQHETEAERGGAVSLSSLLMPPFAMNRRYLLII